MRSLKTARPHGKHTKLMTENTHCTMYTPLWNVVDENNTRVTFTFRTRPSSFSITCANTHTHTDSHTPGLGFFVCVRAQAASNSHPYVRAVTSQFCHPMSSFRTVCVSNYARRAGSGTRTASRVAAAHAQWWRCTRTDARIPLTTFAIIIDTGTATETAAAAVARCSDDSGTTCVVI